MCRPSHRFQYQSVSSNRRCPDDAILLLRQPGLFAAVLRFPPASCGNREVDGPDPAQDVSKTTDAEEACRRDHSREWLWPVGSSVCDARYRVERRAGRIAWTRDRSCRAKDIIRRCQKSSRIGCCMLFGGTGWTRITKIPRLSRRLFIFLRTSRRLYVHL